MSTYRGIDDHLEWLRWRNLSPRTIEERRYALRRFAAVVHKPLLEVTVEDVERWQATLIGTPNYRLSEISHVCGFYRWALMTERLTADPTIRIARPKRPRALPRPISEENLQISILGAPKRIKPWLVLAAWEGLRAAEIAHLTRDAVLDSIEIPALLVRGKGDKERVVPLGQTALDALREHGLPSHGYVFRRHDGRPGPNSPRHVSHLCNRYLHSIGVQETLHQLRHRFATQAYQRSRDIRAVQELLGHASPSTTAGYAAYAKAEAAAVVRALDGSAAAGGPAGPTAALLP